MFPLPSSFCLYADCDTDLSDPCPPPPPPPQTSDGGGSESGASSTTGGGGTSRRRRGPAFGRTSRRKRPASQPPADDTRGFFKLDSLSDMKLPDLSEFRCWECKLPLTHPKHIT